VTIDAAAQYGAREPKETTREEAARLTEGGIGRADCGHDSPPSDKAVIEIRSRTGPPCLSAHWRQQHAVLQRQVDAVEQFLFAEWFVR
jgi:hypothetical protein